MMYSHSFYKYLPAFAHEHNIEPFKKKKNDPFA